MGLVSKEGNTDGLTTYSKEDTSKLAKIYTPEQLRVIEAGEEAVSIDDIKSHGVIRTDPYRLPYFDDLSVIRPVVDKRPKVAATAHPNARWMDEDEAVDAVNAWITKAEERNESDRPSDYAPAAGQEDKYGGLKSVDFARFIEEGELMVGGGHMGSSALAPALYSPDEVQEISKASTSQQVDDRDPEGKYDRLKRQTGMSLDEILRCRAKPLVRHRVVNQTRLGKIQSQYVLSIAGNGNGMLGIGEAKATEPDEAMDKANQAAIRNLKPIPRYENRTIFGDVEGKVSAVKVQLMARPPGTFQIDV
jgi:small subunit ribosomal protein S5